MGELLDLAVLALAPDEVRGPQVTRVAVAQEVAPMKSGGRSRLQASVPITMTPWSSSQRVALRAETAVALEVLRPTPELVGAGPDQDDVVRAQRVAGGRERPLEVGDGDRRPGSLARRSSRTPGPRNHSSGSWSIVRAGRPALVGP